MGKAWENSVVKIEILQIGSTKEKAILGLEEEYEKRIKPYAKLESISLTASKSDERSRAQVEERDNFIKRLDTDAVLLALDENGKLLSSLEFAEFIGKIRDFESGKIQFLIGGSHGLHPDLLELARYKISFSKMSFTHEMIRIFLKEQIYRAFMILSGKKYHK